jgi:RNA polymerase sigma-70 factor, ECF subfamily
MLRVARAYVSGAHSAEDAVQDAWLGVIRGLAAFEGRCALRTWVFTILVNRARSRGSREARTVQMSGLAGEDGGPTVDPDRFRGPNDRYPGGWTPAGRPVQWEGQPEGRVLAGEAVRLLESALTALPPRQRIVVTLRDVPGLTSEEACEALGITAQNQRGSAPPRAGGPPAGARGLLPVLTVHHAASPATVGGRPATGAVGARLPSAATAHPCSSPASASMA